MKIKTMNSFLISNTNAKGPGFGLFSPTHLFILFLLAVLIFAISHYYRKSNPTQRMNIRIFLALFIIFIEVVRDIILVMTGQFTSGDWPFQLCGVGIFIVAYDAWSTDYTSQSLLYSLTLPGALAALITPDWVANNSVNFFVWQSFLIHALLVGYVLMQLIARELYPDFRQLWRVVIFLFIVTPLAALLNQAWHQNFFFIQTPVPGSPLEPVAQIFGSFYLLGMVLLIGFVWVIMYLPWSFSKVWKPKQTN